MDPLRLLSRSTRLSKTPVRKDQPTTPSRGQHAKPQIITPIAHTDGQPTKSSRKRKRGSHSTTAAGDNVNGQESSGDRSKRPSTAFTSDQISGLEGLEDAGAMAQDGHLHKVIPADSDMTSEAVKKLLKHHKLKITWLNHTDVKHGKVKSTSKPGKSPLFPQPLRLFPELSARYSIPSRLATNISDQGYSAPTEVQLCALPLLLDDPDHFLPPRDTTGDEGSGAADEVDLLTVAPTGSGKTLAFMIPLLHKMYQAKPRDEKIAQATSAIILAPTKELVGQIVNEGRKMANGTGIRVTQLRKGMRLALATVQQTREGDEEDNVEDNEQPVVKADIIVSTPGLLHSMLNDGGMKQTSLPAVRHLVLDEADVLLDPLFRDQTLGVWGSLPSPDLRVNLWSATMGSNIEELARSTINDRRKRLSAETDGTVQEAPLIRLVVGLKDSAVPNVRHKLIYAATEQGKLMGLRQLLHPGAPSTEAGASLLPPFLVFTQTIERAVALHSELLYDIPAEAGGISRISVLHSDLSDTARDSVMTRFRKGEIWVLITTDLLSRGVDFRGVNGVVNYDIPTSSAAYVHRVGRTGRAGREGGVAVTLYSKEDIPYLKHVANVVAMAQKQKGSAGDDGVQQWLLDALPSLSKPEKQKLKQRGIESRTARGKETDPRAARQARISTKPGFVRQAENNRKGAIAGSKRRVQAETASDSGEETDFGGFD